jgi:hypothetical protein
MKLVATWIPRVITAQLAAALPHNRLAISASALVLAVSSLLSLGCGVTVNSSTGSAAGQGGGGSTGAGAAGGTGASGGIAGQTIPVPSVSQALTGCANPNTGIAGGDWGVGTNPVYTFVDNQTPVVGEPMYTSNTIFWTSRENGPGQSILMAGAFTKVTKTARLALIPAGTIDWETLVRGSSTVISTTQQGTTGLSFIVPANFLAGVYGFEIQDPSTSPIFGLANAPSLNWAIGVPSVTEAAQALQHQVYDCGAEQGGTLRIFGKNFTASDQVILQLPTGTAYSLKPSTLDTNTITVAVPKTFAPGNYNMWVGSFPWDATSSAAAQITVNSPLALSARKVACSTLAGDGVTDDTKHLQSCLDWYAPLAGSKEVAYIAIPAGTFVLTDQVTTHPYEVLVGSSSASTKFIGRPRNLPPVAWFKVSPHFGMADLSLTAPANPNLLLTPGIQTGNPLTSGHLFFNGVSFSSTSDASKGAESMFALAGPDIQVYNSFFLSNSNQVFDINYGDGGIVSGNEIVVNDYTGLGISDSQNIIFEKNRTHSQNTPGQGKGNHSGGTGLSISRGNSQWGQSALSRDIYVGYNTFDNMGSNDQQVITNDGDGGAYFGPVASSNASTVTLAHDPAWNWMGTTNPQAAMIAILSGIGVGQYSLIESYSGRTINLVNPWKVPPDSSSVVVISQYELNMTIAHNTITNTLGTAIVLGDALEGVIEDNTMTNSGAGVLISAFGPYGGPAAYGPVMNTDVLRNTIAVGDGNFIWHSVNTNVAGIGIQVFPGCLESGLLVRNNIVASIDTIYNTDGLNGVNANLIEQNQANWNPTFTDSQFLIQDNSPPPS